jgi:hypothetical protein
MPVHFGLYSGIVFSYGGIPRFGKWFDETHHPELVEGEGLGEIFRNNMSFQ